jgi:hypothetical protein
MAFGFFDGQKADASPESIKRKRAMIAQLLSGGRAPRNIGEGFSSIGDSVAAAILGVRADAEEKAGNAERARIMGGINFGGAPMAAVGGASVATGAVSGKGYDNPQARETYEYAIAQGLAPHQAAAYTGAKLAESRFNPNARNPGDGRDGSDSIGGFQWNSGRAQALKQYAAQQGKSWNDPAVQRAFSFAELNGSERAAGQALRNAKTPEEATAAMLSYLRPGGWTARNPLGAHSAPARLRNTQGILSAFGNMPVINPGNGATPMPLARQQAQTAPMPNVASVQGDNPQQLLADAAYYEKNGNPEAARQMRERAQLATARPVQTASAGPKSNEGQMQDGAGELQAGGSEMMGLAGVGVNPAAPPDMAQIAGAQGFADNEEQTRIMEAQMAAEQGLPYAGNEPGLLSPVPMGFGPNPFLPYEPDAMAQAPAAPAPAMSRATFDQVTAELPPRAPTFTGRNAGIAPSWGIGDPDAPAPDAQEVSVRPARDTVSLPAANIQPPQSPAMRAPLPVDMGGENSGGSAIQFIESEFARREGRPDPRSAIGAPQGYNPFVPQSLQAQQMAGDGGSVQGASQGGAMASGAAQPQQAGMITPQNVRAVMSSPFTSDADKRFVMDMWNQQQARAQAEAERQRVQAQNEAAADALKLDRRLANTPAAVSAQAGQMLNNEPAKIAATVAAREAEGRRLGLQGAALQNFALTGQMPVSSQDNLDAQVAARKKVAEQSGLKPGDPRYDAYVLTGNMPRQNEQPLTATDRKAILEADEGVLAGETAIKALKDAKVLSPRANQGWLASERAALGNNLPDLMVPDFVSSPQSSQDTVVYENAVLGQALSQLKSIFGAAPTEGERKILLDLQASVSKPDKVRQQILDTAIGLAEKRLAFNKQRAAELRGGEFYKPENKRGGPSSPQSGQSTQTTPAQASAALQNARKAIADGAPRQAVIDRLRQAGIDPGGL